MNETTTTTKKKIRLALLLGSVRDQGNGVALSVWLSALLNKYLAQQQQQQQTSNNSTPLYFELIHVDLKSFALGPLVEDRIPASVESSSNYASESVRKWSAFVRECKGFVILTPQHNWGYPAALKNALDHLFHEWSDKPVMLVTYGGHGGTKCGAQLRQVLGGALKMKVVEDEVSITLPSQFIRTADRLKLAEYSHVEQKVTSVEAEAAHFLREYEEPVRKAAHRFVQLF